MRDACTGAPASPSVANAAAVSTASRTSSRSERFVGRPVVVGGNMCSAIYERVRTERARCGIPRLRSARNLALQRAISAQNLQSILQIGPPGTLAAMVHLRIVSPPDLTDAVIEVLDCTPSVINIVRLGEPARRPDGDMILCDVAREDASVILSDLQGPRRPREWARSRSRSIDTAISRYADAAETPRARRAGRRRRLGGGRGADDRERRAVRRVPALHGARRADRGGRHLPRLARS